MKSVDFLKALGGVVAVVIACNTYAQSSDAMASGAMAAPSAKMVKKENRQLGRKVRGRKAVSRAHEFEGCPIADRQVRIALKGRVHFGSPGFTPVLSLHSTPEPGKFVCHNALRV